LPELGVWVRDAILKLGGAAIPDGDLWTLITPEHLRQRYRLALQYERVCFDRSLALRTRNVELGGIGHPLVDALLTEGRSPSLQGSVFGVGTGRSVMANYLIYRRNERGRHEGRVFHFVYDETTDRVSPLRRLESRDDRSTGSGPANISRARERIEAALHDAIIQWLPDRQSRAGLQISLTGIGLC
jgi:hypothetical protein